MSKTTFVSRENAASELIFEMRKLNLLYIEIHIDLQVKLEKKTCY